MFLLAGIVYAKGVYYYGGETVSGAAGYDLSETWDGDTEDETWAVSGTPDDDYTVTPIEGAQDCLLDQADSVTVTLDSAQGNYYVIMKMDLNACGSTGTYTGLSFLEADNTCIAYIHALHHTIPDTYRVYVGHSGCGTEILDTSMYGGDHTGILYVKLIYEKGTGADGVVTGYLVEDSEYDSNGWTNADGGTSSSTTDTVDVAKVQIFVQSNVITEIDTIRGNTTDDIDY